MRPLKEYSISFTGLKPGEHQFKYFIRKEFFEDFNYDDILDADVEVILEVIKKTTLLELHFKAKGNVKVVCDISNEPYDQTIQGNLDTVVKFGNEYNDDNEDIIIIPFDEHQINVAQFIYEMIVLSVPSKRIHPGIEDGTLQSDILEKLNDLQPGKNKESDKIDPRWADLKKLITNKKT
ncbi:MAG: DUF177 domain-containing protein [Bacteroidota bacterium]